MGEENRSCFNQNSFINSGSNSCNNDLACVAGALGRNAAVHVF